MERTKFKQGEEKIKIEVQENEWFRKVKTF